MSRRGVVTVTKNTVMQIIKDSEAQFSHKTEPMKVLLVRVSWKRHC
jgi:response regulator of citrate/malate metabolism